MLTVVIPENEPIDREEIRQGLINTSQIWNGRTHYLPGDGSMPTDLDVAVDRAVKGIEINRSLWAEFARSVSR